MRLLLFSDLHRDERAARALVNISRNVDIAIGAGDFGTKRVGTSEVINVLAAISCPTILVPGNSESKEELDDACRNWPSASVLHGSGTNVLGIPFWGVGGAIPVTPFGEWSYDFSEDQGRELFEACPTQAVVVSHSPPKGTVDRSSSGQNLGSEAVREMAEQRAPLLVVCGHIHDSWGQSDRIGDTPIVNAGPGGFVWELSD